MGPAWWTTTTVTASVATMDTYGFPLSGLTEADQATRQVRTFVPSAVSSVSRGCRMLPYKLKRVLAAEGAGTGQEGG